MLKFILSGTKLKATLEDEDSVDQEESADEDLTDEDYNQRSKPGGGRAKGIEIEDIPVLTLPFEDQEVEQLYDELLKKNLKVPPAAQEAVEEWDHSTATSRPEIQSDFRSKFDRFSHISCQITVLTRKEVEGGEQRGRPKPVAALQPNRDQSRPKIRMKR